MIKRGDSYTPIQKIDLFQKDIGAVGKIKRLATMTLGCKVNQYETEAIEEMFLRQGYRLVEFHETADVYLINTCTVTAMSDRKCRQMIRRTKKLNPQAIVAVSGCYSQKSPEEILAIPEVNIVLGTSNRSILIEAVERCAPKDKVVLVEDIMKQRDFEEMNIRQVRDHTRAFIKIQDGCDRYCSYCIIPYTRGPIRSRLISDIIAETKRLVTAGYREVVLTGIHVASYGKDLQRQQGAYDLDLITVIEELSQIPNLQRIRTSSVEPLIITEENIRRLKKIPEFCPHFHLSLQSGCNATLKRMNRRYTAEEYEEAVALIRSNFESPVITTDVIVGFPGETEDEFEETVSFLKRLSLYETHIFKFSAREGTPAAVMENHVSGEKKQQRSERLIQLSAENQERFHGSMENRVEDVLFETWEEGIAIGRCKNYVRVQVESLENISSQILPVHLMKGQVQWMEGRLKNRVGSNS